MRQPLQLLTYCQRTRSAGLTVVMPLRELLVVRRGLWQDMHEDLGLWRALSQWPGISIEIVAVGPSTELDSCVSHTRKPRLAVNQALVGGENLSWEQSSRILD